MLKMEDIDRIRENGSLSVKKKVALIASFIDSDRLIYDKGKYYYQFTDEDMPVILKSSSIIKVRKNPIYSEYNEGPLYQYHQYRQAIERIMRAINSICLIEDRIIFVERFIHHKKIDQITYDHYLSTRAYYTCLYAAFTDFCRNMMIDDS